MSETTEVLAGEFLPGFGAARDAAPASEAMRQGTALPHPSDAKKMEEQEAANVGIQLLNSGRIAVEGVGEMEMHVDHQLHLVSIWLPNDEKDIAILEPVYRQYKGTKYRVAVFRSGREDLRSNTAKLLQFNK